MFYIKSFSLLFIYIISTNLKANENNIKQAVERSRSLNLSESTYWHKLMHYKKTSLFQNNIKSEVLSPEFFISKIGDLNSQAELEATIKEILISKTRRSKHAQCQFPARFEWLSKKLNWNDQILKKQKCPQYEKWSYNNQIESISLIFATGYLGNPASYFGHPLLKFNLSPNASPHKLFDLSLNYGAFTPPNENGVIYAIKGIFGGYDAGFTHLNFYYHNHNYSEIELRDMWDYKLNLSDEQIKKIIAHSWEVLGLKFSYYFFKSNCAYAMANLLSLSVDDSLLPKRVPYSMPFTFFEKLAAAKNLDNTPLVKKINLIPSRHSRMKSKFLTLSKNSKKIIKAITEKNGIIPKEYNDVIDLEKNRILETLFDYYSFRISQDSDNSLFKNIKKKILLERLKLPSKKMEWPKIKRPYAHKGQRPVQLQSSYINSHIHDKSFELRLRPAFYDFLSIDTGRPPDASLAVADIRLSLEKNNVALKGITAIEIQSLNISETGLQGDGGMAWKLAIGAKNLNLACKDCLATGVEAAIGKAYQTTKNVTTYGFLDVGLKSSINKSEHISLTPQISSIIKINKHIKSHIQAGKRYYSRSFENMLNITTRFGNSRKWDIRVKYEHHVDDQTSISYSYFW